MKDDEGDEDLESEDMTSFYRAVADLGTYVRSQPNAVLALDDIAKNYRPRGIKESVWLSRTHDILIAGWINYSPEIQEAMKYPVPPEERMTCAYRDALEFVLSRGEYLR